MRYLTIASLGLVLSCSLWAQQPITLRMGDTVPDLAIGPLQNYPKSSARFSDFKGKVVILDFWFGACPGCIKAFPKLEALQKKFGDSIQVIMVNFESKEQIEKTFNKWKNIYDYRFPLAPSIVGDTLLHRLFPHRFVPHEVWIDPKGVIRAFTSAKEVTEANIRALLEGRPVRMEMKLDNFTFKGDEAPTLTQVYGEYPNGLKYYSAILNYIPGIIAGVSRRNIDSAQNTIRVTRRNISIPHLFANAVGNSMGGDPFESPEFDFGKRVVLDVKDSNRYIYRPRQGMTPEEWRVKNCFTYEAVMPLSQQEKDMFTAMHYELERFFNVTCRIEKRRMKCFSLVRVPDQAKVLQVAKWNVEYPKDTSYLQVKGYTTDRLLERISTANRYTPYVFCDRTGIMNRFDIRIKKSILSDIPGLKQELRKQCNLDLIETEQELEVLVIKENQ